jgi:hypothetical protein
MLKRIPRFIQLPVLAMIIITMLLGACAANAPALRSDYEMVAMEAPAAPMEESMPYEEINKFATGEYTDEAVVSDSNVERIVIKNANLSIVVEDPAKSMENIGTMAEEMGGFIVSAELYKQELDSGVQVPRASINIRIPAERLNEALDIIKSESDQDPQSESINSQDVTSEYVDLQSRLKNLEAAENQLTEIMESAKKTEDVLAVYNELVDVRGEIEVIKGQINYYDQSAKFSSVQVELLADEAVQPLTVGAWQPQGVAKDAIQALINSFKFLVNLIIWVIIFLLPLLLVIYLIVFLPLSQIWKSWRKRRAQRKAKSDSDKTEQLESNAE